MSQDRPRERLDVLVVGPTRGQTGGVARYIAEQCRRLPTGIDTRTHDTGAMGGSRSGSVFVVVVRSLLQLLRFPFRAPPDLFHVHLSAWASFYRNSLYVLYAALVWRCPIVLHVHAPNFDRFVTEASLPSRAFQRVVFNAADAIVVLSERWRGLFDGIADPETIHVLSNAIDPEEYTPDNHRKSATRRPHLIFLADHVERKGITEVVGALDTLAEKDVGEFRVTIAGSGPLSERAEAAAERHPHVEYRGYVTEAEKRELLAAATVYVLPTHAEGLPIGVLEAMASETAIVSTPVGDIPSVLDGDRGVLVDPGDSDELAGALADLVASPERVGRMAENGREHVLETYTWERVAERLAGLYRDLV